MHVLATIDYGQMGKRNQSTVPRPVMPRSKPIDGDEGAWQTQRKDIEACIGLIEV